LAADGGEIVPGQTIPAVTGVVPVAVNFTKGCYPGQELVERMDSRGADAPMSLRIVDVPAGTVGGDPLVVDGVEVGTITSVSPQGGLALGMVRRGHDVGRPPVQPPWLSAMKCRRLPARCDRCCGEAAWSDGVGGGDVAADRDDVGMLTDADQLG
jgi:folate-binding protein YgfZ